LCRFRNFISFPSVRLYFCVILPPIDRMEYVYSSFQKHIYRPWRYVTLSHVFTSGTYISCNNGEQRRRRRKFTSD
jgi:hypothetical protein